MWAAGRVYTQPAQVVERLTADPHASERLRAGHAAVYGQIHGRPETLLRRPDRTQQEALGAVPTLRSALDRYHGSERAAAQAQAPANAIGESLPKLRDQLQHLNRTLQRVEQAMKGPEKAIEAIVREIGPEAARLAVSTLSRELPFRVELAIRAVERVLDRGLGLGR